MWCWLTYLISIITLTLLSLNSSLWFTVPVNVKCKQPAINEEGEAALIMAAEPTLDPNVPSGV